jgi:hypothetical protein
MFTEINEIINDIARLKRGSYEKKRGGEELNISKNELNLLSIYYTIFVILILLIIVLVVVILYIYFFNKGGSVINRYN